MTENQIYKNPADLEKIQKEYFKSIEDLDPIIFTDPVQKDRFVDNAKGDFLRAAVRNYLDNPNEPGSFKKAEKLIRDSKLFDNKQKTTIIRNIKNEQLEALNREFKREELERKQEEARAKKLEESLTSKAFVGLVDAKNLEEKEEILDTYKAYVKTGAISPETFNKLERQAREVTDEIDGIAEFGIVQQMQMGKDVRPIIIEEHGRTLKSDTASRLYQLQDERIKEEARNPLFKKQMKRSDELINVQFKKNPLGGFLDQDKAKLMPEIKIRRDTLVRDGMNPIRAARTAIAEYLGDISSAPFVRGVPRQMQKNRDKLAQAQKILQKRFKAIKAPTADQKRKYLEQLKAIERRIDALDKMDEFKEMKNEIKGKAEVK
jgi:hypothetical protein